MENKEKDLIEKLEEMSKDGTVIIDGNGDENSPIIDGNAAGDEEDTIIIDGNF